MDDFYVPLNWEPKSKLFEREEKLKISQAYKKKNQRQHPAFKK